MRNMCNNHEISMRVKPRELYVVYLYSVIIAIDFANPYSNSFGEWVRRYKLEFGISTLALKPGLKPLLRIRPSKDGGNTGAKAASNLGASSHTFVLQCSSYMLPFDSSPA